MESVTRFLETRLKLKVNRAKSAVALVWERKFLGYRLLSGGKLGIASQSVARVKEKVRQITRRKLRCLKLKQCKRAVGIARFLQERGVERNAAWKLGGSGKGWWRIALSPQAHRAMGKKWFEEIGLAGFTDRYTKLELFT